MADGTVELPPNIAKLVREGTPESLRLASEIIAWMIRVLANKTPVAQVAGNPPAPVDVVGGERMPAAVPPGGWGSWAEVRDDIAEFHAHLNAEALGKGILIGAGIVLKLGGFF